MGKTISSLITCNILCLVCVWMQKVLGKKQMIQHKTTRIFFIKLSDVMYELGKVNGIIAKLFNIILGD
jgi:hypothetical protein